jgi:hypothetical protein
MNSKIREAILVKNRDLILWLLEMAAGENEGRYGTREAHKRVYYLLKLCDVIWFEEEIPDNNIDNFEIFLNGNWSGKPPNPFTEVSRLSNFSLSYLCRKLTKPSWLNGTYATVIIKLPDLPVFWEYDE